ncbi:MAG: hypothetical protein LH628_15720 [Microcoleus sp. CAN_BIN18]|nr:hypothetical protein [Microcoleus sp. CAN_BIN18]
MVALINSIAHTSNFSGQNVARIAPVIPQMGDRASQDRSTTSRYFGKWLVVSTNITNN